MGIEARKSNQSITNNEESVHHVENPFGKPSPSFLSKRSLPFIVLGIVILGCLSFMGVSYYLGKTFFEELNRTLNFAELSQSQPKIGRWRSGLFSSTGTIFFGEEKSPSFVIKFGVDHYPSFHESKYISLIRVKGKGELSTILKSVVRKSYLDAPSIVFKGEIFPSSGQLAIKSSELKSRKILDTDFSVKISRGTLLVRFDKKRSPEWIQVLLPSFEIANLTEFSSVKGKNLMASLSLAKEKETRRLNYLISLKNFQAAPRDAKRPVFSLVQGTIKLAISDLPQKIEDYFGTILAGKNIPMDQIYGVLKDSKFLLGANLDLTEGKLATDGQFTLRKGLEDFEPTLFLKQINGTAKISLPRKAVLKYLPGQTAAIDAFASQGYLTLIESDYTTHLKLSEGRIELNNKVLPMLK